MKHHNIIPIREAEIIDDEMLGFITGGSLDSINSCGENICDIHTGNCTGRNQCSYNTGDCSPNTCGLHRKTDIENPIEQPEEGPKT